MPMPCRDETQWQAIIAAPLAQRRKEEAVDGLVRLLRVCAADSRAVRRHLCAQSLLWPCSSADSAATSLTATCRMLS
jgi:hypothetical protein